MTFAIIGDRIEIDGLHVATLHRPLGYGTRDQLTKWLDLGATLDPEVLEKGEKYDADMDKMEDAISEAEDEAREANDRARAAEEEAEGYLEALKNIAFAAGKAGSVSGLDLERLTTTREIHHAIMQAMDEGRDAARKA